MKSRINPLMAALIDINEIWPATDVHTWTPLQISLYVKQLNAHTVFEAAPRMKVKI